MKKCLSLLLILSLLTSCALPSPLSEAEALRRRYADAAGLSLDAEITADYGDRAYPFSLHLEKTGEGWEIRVTEPQALAGLTARCKEGSLQLEYQDLILDTGDLSPLGITPMNALPLMAEAWAKGHLEEVLHTGDGLLSIQYTVEDGVTVLTLFDPESSLPLRGELSLDGVTVIYCHFQNAVLKEKA